VVLIGDQVSAIHERAAPHFKSASPVVDIALHTLRSAMDHEKDITASSKSTRA